jgi:hypothetical protein
VLPTSFGRLSSLVRMSVLSRLGGSIAWSVRWSPLATDTGCSPFGWALGPSEAPRSESGGGLWGSAETSSTRESSWVGPVVSDANGTRARRGGERSGELLLNGQVRAANWQTSRAKEDSDYQRDRGDPTKPRDTQLGQVKRASNSTTCLAGDATKRPEAATNKDALGSGGVNQGQQIRAGRWCTAVVQDAEQSGQTQARGPGQTSQVREASWITPNVRDYKDTSVTQGQRKSPNLGTQVQQAKGLTPDASRRSTAGRTPGTKRGTTKNSGG